MDYQELSDMLKEISFFNIERFDDVIYLLFNSSLDILKAFIQDIEDVLYSNDFADPNIGYQKFYRSSFQIWVIHQWLQP